MWLTFLPFHRKPNLISFFVSAIRMLLLTALVVAALYPLFVLKYPHGFKFNLTEGFLLASIFIFFEEHARWNFTINALDKKLAAIKFFLFISIAELVLPLINVPSEIELQDLLLARVPPTALHLFMCAIAYFFADRTRATTAIAFCLSVAAHVSYNKLLAGRVASLVFDN